MTLDRTWGDLVGVAITGTDRARGVAFVQAYYTKHLTSKRNYDSQYSLRYAAEEKLYTDNLGQRFIARQIHRSWDPARNAEIDAASVDATVIGLVYYPCAE